MKLVSDRSFFWKGSWKVKLLQRFRASEAPLLWRKQRGRRAVPPMRKEPLHSAEKPDHSHFQADAESEFIFYTDAETLFGDSLVFDSEAVAVGGSVIAPALRCYVLFPSCCA